jgi:hypothetical protein
VRQVQEDRVSDVRQVKPLLTHVPVENQLCHQKHATTLKAKRKRRKKRVSREKYSVHLTGFRALYALR